MFDHCSHENANRLQISTIGCRINIHSLLSAVDGASLCSCRHQVIGVGESMENQRAFHTRLTQGTHRIVWNRSINRYGEIIVNLLSRYDRNAQNRLLAIALEILARLLW